ncbi:MAG: prolyl oligopeptidase family serine peptidase [Acidobacteria bacterium]|nr:prolyl oligopeptidase family serine peptidase [Acidobacteriota bacterium]
MIAAMLTRRSLLAGAGAGFSAEVPKNRLARPADVEEVRIPSTLDGQMQPTWLLPPPAGKPAPLVVHLHTWSAHYNHSGGLDEALAECRARGWAMISPDFRGPNDHPQACASRFAVQDVLDAVEFARRRLSPDPRRLYVAGGSGGGHMTLVMAHAAPHLWAAVSAWVPITHLADWHAFSRQQGTRYYKMLESCCGGPPGTPQTDAEYSSRSPLLHLAKAAGLPVAIDVGIRDGHQGSVPVNQSLRAFNVLASANGARARQLAASAIDIITRESRIPEGLHTEDAEGPRKRKVLFRRTAGPLRLSVFDGGHEIDFPEAMRWLEPHRRRK